MGKLESSIFLLIIVAYSVFVAMVLSSLFGLQETLKLVLTN